MKTFIIYNNYKINERNKATKYLLNIIFNYKKICI